MIKKVGQLIELDPEKKYIMLVNSNTMSENDIKLLSDAIIAQQNSLLTISLPNGFETIEFVENSDRVFDVVEKHALTSEEK